MNVFPIGKDITDSFPVYFQSTSGSCLVDTSRNESKYSWKDWIIANNGAWTWKGLSNVLVIEGSNLMMTVILVQVIDFRSSSGLK